MPEMRERDQKYSFIDWIEFIKKTEGNVFSISSWHFNEVSREFGEVTISGVPTQKFTREQRIINQIKEHAEDVEFEEI